MAPQPASQESSLTDLQPKDFRLFVQTILGHIRNVQIINKKDLSELVFDRRQMEDLQVASILTLAFDQALDQLVSQGCIYRKGKDKNTLIYIRDLPKGLPAMPLLNRQQPTTR